MSNGDDMRNDQLLSSRTHAFSGTDVWDLVRMRAQHSADRTAFVGHPYHGSPRGDDWFTWRAGERDDFSRRPLDPMAPMGVQYRSGTTSRPRGVLWTHATALWAARVNAGHEDLHPSDCHLIYLPLFHVNALGYQMLASMWVGSRFVLVPKWSTSRFWDVSVQHGCTWLSLIGLSPRALFAGSAGEITARHRYRLFGSGVCDTPIDAALGVKTIGWWGMTETISHGIVGNPETPDHPLSMGRAAPEDQIAVV